jgi:hypothetical protein
MWAYEGLMDPTRLSNGEGSIPDDDSVNRKVNLLCGGKVGHSMSRLTVREIFNCEGLR